MGTYIKYECDECGFEYEDDLAIFWIDKGMELHVSQLTFLTSEEMSKSLVSGYYHEYYCYECDNFAEEFLISENPSGMNHESIIKLIEGWDDDLKVIKFDIKFQNCIDCANPLDSKSTKLFSFDKENNFNISEKDYREYVLLEDNENDQFWGIYHGYYCDDCSKQINKFVIKENSAKLNEDTIKAILENHTNDLTVLIFDYKNVCPNCGSDLEFLNQSALCPECRQGHLMTVDMINID